VCVDSFGGIFPERKSQGKTDLRSTGARARLAAPPCFDNAEQLLADFWSEEMRK
jgi:hypothetical protein